MATKQNDKIYVSALTEFAKVLRTSHFYPPGHPTLEQAIERAHLYLKNLLKLETELEFTINKSAILFQGEPLKVSPKVIQDLAFPLFRRRVKKLHMRIGVSPHEIASFINIFRREPEELAKQGNVEDILARSGVDSIWCNERQFQRRADEPPPEEDPFAALQAMELQEAGEMPVEHEADATEDDDKRTKNLSPQIRQGLEILVNGRDGNEIAQTLKQIVPLAREEMGRVRVRDAMTILYRIEQAHRRPELPDKLRAGMESALRALAPKPVVEELIRLLKTTLGNQWERPARVLLKIGPPAIPFLLLALVDSQSRRERMRIIEVIKGYQRDAIEPLKILLEDERWFVVRNSLSILGEFGYEDTVKLIAPFLSDENPKLRKEAATALRKIGTDAAFKLLVKRLGKADWEEKRWLVTEIAYMPQEHVISSLLPYLEKGPVWMRQEVAQALGSQTSEEALAALGNAFVGKKSLFGKKNAAIRKIVGEQLLNRLPESLTYFESVRNDTTPDIRRLVSKADEVASQLNW